MPNKILIIKPSALGDIATTLPLLCDLKRAYPAAKIDWLIHPAYATLIQNHDALHEIIPFDRKKLAAWWYKPSAFKLFTTLLKTLRKNNYDVVIDAQGLFRSGFFTYITRAKTRIGFADAREGGSFFYTHKIPIRRRDALSVVRMRTLLDPLRIPHDAAPEYRVPLNPQAVAKAIPLIPENAIGLIPGCRGQGKRWPADAFAAVVSQLAKRYPVVLFGSSDERPLCDQILSQSASNGHARLNLAGQTSIAEMTAALTRCRLIIGNDTGPLHVAVALGKTIIGLYGRTDPSSVGPYGQLENVVRFNSAQPWPPVAVEVLSRVSRHLDLCGSPQTV